MVEWLKDHTIKCSYKTWLGVECPGCGTQRAIIALLNGDFTESLLYNPAILPFLFTLIYCVLHLRFGFQTGARNTLILFCITVSLMIVNFVVKSFFRQ